MSNHIINELNQLIAEHFPQLFRSSASYMYYTDKKGNQYFYTVKRIDCGCKQMPKRGHYVAGKYRFIKSRREYKLVKKVCFAKKYKAMEWAEDRAYPNEG